MEELEKAFSENTKRIIVNNPNNPTGKVTPFTHVNVKGVPRSNYGFFNCSNFKRARITAAAGTNLLSNRSLENLKCTHSNYGASSESRISIFTGRNEVGPR